MGITRTTRQNSDSDAPKPGAVQAYERRLDADGRWALAEGSRYFQGKSALQDALRGIARRLDELGIPYAVGGGLALFAHGYRRFTEDIDVLVTAEGLETIHRELEGLGYLPLFAGSRHLRDANSAVRIEFLVSGQYPGDGKPKPVAFPDPSSVSIEKDGIKYLTLPALIELKLASGMTNSARLKDLADVVELVQALRLPMEFADQLDPFVRDKYAELWRSLDQAAKQQE